MWLQKRSFMMRLDCLRTGALTFPWGRGSPLSTAGGHREDVVEKWGSSSENLELKPPKLHLGTIRMRSALCYVPSEARQEKLSVLGLTTQRPLVMSSRRCSWTISMILFTYTRAGTATLISWMAGDWNKFDTTTAFKDFPFLHPIDTPPTRGDEVLDIIF